MNGVVKDSTIRVGGHVTRMPLVSRMTRIRPCFLQKSPPFLGGCRAFYEEVSWHYCDQTLAGSHLEDEQLRVFFRAGSTTSLPLAQCYKNAAQSLT